MASAKKISIELEGKIVFDQNTAELCLKVVEVYMNQNHIDIQADEDESGKLSLRFTEA